MRAHGRRLLALVALLCGLAGSAWAGYPPGIVSSTQLIGTTSDATVTGVLVDTYKQSSDPDDTLSISRCVAAGVVCRLGLRTYTANGQFNFTGITTLVGTQGVSTIARTSALTSGTWVNFAGATTQVQGVTWQADGSTAAYRVAATVTSGKFYNNSFQGGDTVEVLGGVLTVAQRFEFVGNEFTGMSYHGLWLNEVANALVSGNYSHDNTQEGILVSYTNNTAIDPAAVNLTIANNHLWNDNVGMRVGNFNIQGGLIGPTDPVAARVVINGNQAFSNTTYGFAIDCDYAAVVGNVGTSDGTLSNLGGAFLVNSRYSTFTGNAAYGNPYYDLDAGGSVGLTISANDFGPALVGVNVGASNTIDIADNKFHGITGDNITAPETDGTGSGQAFPGTTADIAIHNNHFDLSALSTSSVWGIHVWDGTQNVDERENDFYASSASGILPAQAIRNVTNAAHVSGNRWDGNRIYQITMGGAAVLIVPTMFDQVQVLDGSQNIQAITSSDGSTFGGGVTWLNATAIGSGCTTAPTVAFSGGGGTGAAAVAEIYNGTTIGYKITTTGSGYTSAPTVTVSGGGCSGVTATAQVGVPWPQERQMRLIMLSGDKIYTGSTYSYGTINIPFSANQNSIDYGAQSVIIDFEYLSNGWNYIATSWPYTSPQNHAGSFSGTGAAGTAGASDSGLVAGLSNTITSGANNSGIMVGSGNSVSANGNGGFIGGGASNTVDANYGTIDGGVYASTKGRYGASCHANGRITTQGDAQTCEGELWQTTAAATAIRLTADGSTARTNASGTGNCWNIATTGSVYAMQIMFEANDITTPANRYLVWETVEMDIGATAGSLRVTVEGTPVVAALGTTTGAALAQTADTTNVCLNTSWTPPTSNTDTWNTHETIISSETAP